MSAITPFPTREADDLASIVARRVRGRIAEMNLSKAAFARSMEMQQQNMSRRLLGHTPFTLQELGLAARLTGTSIAYLSGETNDPRPVDPDGGSRWCAHRDSNPEPAGLQHAQVIDMGSRRGRELELAEVA